MTLPEPTVEPAPEPRLRVADVHKSFRLGPQEVPVLAGVSFELAAGEVLAVTGPSGSGKSTLLHVLGALEPPSSGRVEIDGVDPFALAEKDLARFRNETVGFVFQDHHLLPQHTVLENVLLPAMAFPVKDPGARRAIEARAAELLDGVGLGHRLGHRPAELSGGERQRAAVARSLINRPSLLLADEPTGSLDHKTADAVADLLFDLHRREGNILVIVTHSLELAGRCPRRCELAEGRCSAA